MHAILGHAELSRADLVRYAASPLILFGFALIAAIFGASPYFLHELLKVSASNPH